MNASRFMKSTCLQRTGLDPDTCWRWRCSIRHPHRRRPGGGSISPVSYLAFILAAVLAGTGLALWRP